MYAVVRTGGKQYRVAAGEVFHVETLEGKVGDVVEIKEVLFVGEGDSVRLGKPLLAGAAVTAEIVDQGRAKKILVFKHKRRKNYRRMKGHRQGFTALKVKEIRG